MKHIIIFLFLTFSLCPLSQAQLSTKSKKAIELYTEADNFRVRGQFTEAINLLTLALEKDKEFVEAYYRLGLVYLTMKSYPNAIANFEKGLSLTNDLRKQKVFWFDLGESYLLVGEYEKAAEILKAFLQAETINKPRIDRAATLLRSAEFALKNKSVVAAYQQRPLSDTVNRFAMQYFPVLTADQQELIFTRRVGHGINEDEDLVISRKTEKGQWSVPVSISRNINSELNEGTCTISADGRRLIFTSCSGRDVIGSCDLYETVRLGNEWSTPKNLGVNVNTAAWESQPALSADGRTLYFVSDRRSGLGRRDIWVSTLNEKNQWTKAVNAGKPINSSFDEISPFIHVNNRTLFFASNGLPGFGGYDIFFVERDSAGWTSPQNLGSPINSHDDQFSLFITSDGNKGYYSHEQTMPSGLSSSKIYELRIPEDKRIKYRSNYVKGVVTDKDSKEPLSARIELIKLETNTVESLVESDSLTGEYLMVLTQGAEYGLYVSKANYLFKSLNFNYSELKDYSPIVVNIELEKAKEGSIAVLSNIFFDVDKYELKEKSIAELQKLLRFLNDNPRARIEIGGHTDNSGSDTHNIELSQKRAQSVHAFLLEKGIQKSRLVPKGYGPKLPVASNDNEEGRQQNRRIEFKIIK